MNNDIYVNIHPLILAEHIYYDLKTIIDLKNGNIICNNIITYNMEKTLIIYVTHTMNENLTFFCNNGYIDNPMYDFIFVFNDPLFKLIFLPQKKNVRVITRENIGGDFGGWTHALFYKDDDGKYTYEKYHFFVLLNSTVRGPFLPQWYNQEKQIYWPELFKSKINDNVKLVGSTINLSGYVCNEYNIKYIPHVQSMLLVTDMIGLKIGIDNKIFDRNFMSMGKIETIIKKEIGFSRAIIEKGFNISCMLQLYRNIDFRNDVSEKLKDVIGDHWYHEKYVGINISPFEVIFFKTNRNVTPKILEKYTKWYFKKPNTNNILKILYGTSEAESIDITKNVKIYFTERTIIDTNFNINLYIGFHQYPNIPKHMYIYMDGVEQPIIIDVKDNKLESNIVYMS